MISLPLFSPNTSEYMLRRPKTLIKYHETELTLKRKDIVQSLSSDTTFIKSQQGNTIQNQ